MNKTVNINLAGIFFHIDEDAYLKLQRYLEAIKHSFTDSQGRSEIVSDIEARIAELFNERMLNDKQVIGIAQVDEVINIMGQPEDYLVDDEIFEDKPNPNATSKTSKKLFRDTDNSYVGGVSSGLAHYFGIDVLWVRLVWILLFFGGGTGILLYILLWVLVPEAVTTSDKLMMKGEPVNISNIEKKIKDGFETVTETVSETVKNVDFQKHGKTMKSASKSFFDTIGDIIMFFLKLFAKFIGVILIIIGASTLIGLIIAVLTFNITDAIHIPGLDIVEAANAASIPIWLASLLAFFAISIPFFFVFYLGLKILINNLKSIGNVAKFSLLGLWLISIIGLITIGVKQASEFAINENHTITEQLQITSNDTLKIKMMGNEKYSRHFGRHSKILKIIYNDNGQKTIYRTDVRLIVRSTKDSLASIKIRKKAFGNSYENAKNRAKNIDYNYALVENELQLNAYLMTLFENKFRDQSVELIVYLPEGAVLYADENTYSFHRNSDYHRDILKNGKEEHYLKIIEDDVICLDCKDESFKVKVDTKNVNLNDKGLEIKKDNSSLKIDSTGVKAKTDDVKVNIDENGIEITSD